MQKITNMAQVIQAARKFKQEGGEKFIVHLYNHATDDVINMLHNMSKAEANWGTAAKSILANVDILTPHASVHKFFSNNDDKKIISQQGEYTNGKWLLKAMYTPAKLKEIIDSKPEDKHPDCSHLWLYNKEGAKVRPEIIGIADNTKNNWDTCMPAYIFETEAGDKVIIQKKYYDYLYKNIPNMTLRASKENPCLSATFIFSGDNVAGIIMPLRTIEGMKVEYFSESGK